MSWNYEIDTVKLIDAVKRNECIWNYRLLDYTNKSQKSKAWTAVCEELLSDYEYRSPNEQYAFKIDVQAKWKTIRDGFTRYCRILKKRSGSPTTSKQYPYYDQLLFLKDLTEDKAQQGQSSYLDPQISPPVEIKILEVPRRSRKRFSESEDHPSDTNDEDKMFLLSLVSAFKKVSDTYKLDVKGKIIDLLKAYGSISSFPVGPTSTVVRENNPGNIQAIKPEPELSMHELFGSDV